MTETLEELKAQVRGDLERRMRVLDKALVATEESCGKASSCLAVLGRLCEANAIEGLSPFIRLGTRLASSRACVEKAKSALEDLERDVFMLEEQCQRGATK